MLVTLLAVFLLQPPPPVPATFPGLQSSPVFYPRGMALPSSDLPPNRAFRDFAVAKAKHRAEALQEAEAAQEWAKTGKTQEAITKYKEILDAADLKAEADTAYLMALEGLGDIYGSLHRQSDAITLYRHLVYGETGGGWATRRAKDLVVRMKFALLLHQMGQYNEALENYYAGLEYLPHDATKMEGDLPLDMGLLSLNAQTTRTDRFPLAAHMILAACQKYTKSEFEYHLREAIKLHPNYAPAHYHLGVSLHYDSSGKDKQPYPAEATTELQKAAALGDLNVYYWATHRLQEYSRPRPKPVAPAPHPVTTPAGTTPTP